VNVSSVSGKLNKYSPAVASRFRNATSVEDVTSIMQDFQEAVDAGHENEAGFPSAAYAASKAGLTTATRVIAGQEEKKGSNVLINSCNPGYVNVGASNIA
jgi:carbonyl reductase 1